MTILALDLGSKTGCTANCFASYQKKACQLCIKHQENKWVAATILAGPAATLTYITP